MYDTVLCVSWLIYSLSIKASALPLQKGTFSIFKIRMKLMDMAEKRYLSLNELFLLGIYKSLAISGKKK